MYYIIYDTEDHDYSIVDFENASWLNQAGRNWVRSINQLVSRLDENGFTEKDYSGFVGYDTFQDYLTIDRKDKLVILLEFSDLSILGDLENLHPELFI